MNFLEYERAALRTAGDISISVCGLGLAGEAGEVADVIKKHVGQGHPLDLKKIAEELGDLLWYVAATAYQIGYNLEDIAAQNVAKLEARYPEGKFSAERSMNRGQE